MKSLLLIVCLAIIIAIVNSLSLKSQNELNSNLINEEWMNFKLKFNKRYESNQEEEARKQIWLNNYLYVENFDESSFQVKLNKFSDRLNSVS
jgi:hypothetical protein